MRAEQGYHCILHKTRLLQNAAAGSWFISLDFKKKKKSEKMHQSMYNVSAKNDAQQEKEKEQKKPLVTETNKPLYLIQQIM